MTKEEKREYMKQYRIYNAKRIHQQQKQYRIDNVDKVIQRRKKYQDENTITIRNKDLKLTYGITFEQEKQMYVAQGGCCAICGNKFKNRKEMHVDHNHTTGKVRQLLCGSCNRGIGFFHEDVSTILKAAEYLNKWLV